MSEKSDYPETMRLLTSENAPLHMTMAVNKKGQTPLHCAAIGVKENGSEADVEACKKVLLNTQHPSTEVQDIYKMMPMDYLLGKLQGEAQTKPN